MTTVANAALGKGKIIGIDKRGCLRSAAANRDGRWQAGARLDGCSEYADGGFVLLPL
jgi:hypothetical protein